MPQNLKRNIAMTFRVDEDERNFIHKKMKATGIGNLRLYLLKMAVSGEIVKADMTDVQECSRLLRNISNNVNQLAKRANEGGNGLCHRTLGMSRRSLLRFGSSLQE